MKYTNKLFVRTEASAPTSANYDYVSDWEVNDPPLLTTRCPTTSCPSNAGDENGRARWPHIMKRE